MSFAKFKQILISALTRQLKKYSIKGKIKDESEAIICGYNSIFWDYRIDLGIRNISIIIEIERKRKDPMHNLVKTLIWHQENSPSYPIILFHVFDEHYSLDNEPSLEMCKFIWGQCRKSFNNFFYVPHNISGLNEAQTSNNKQTQKYVLNRITKLVSRTIEATMKQIKS